MRLVMSRCHLGCDCWRRACCGCIFPPLSVCDGVRRRCDCNAGFVVTLVFSVHVGEAVERPAQGNLENQGFRDRASD
jgi:hypothetical protein